MNVLATADDHVVDPAGDKQIPFGIDIPGVAGEVPAAAQGAGSRRRGDANNSRTPLAGHVGDDLAILAGHGSGIGAVGAEADDPNTLVEPGLAGRAGLCRGARGSTVKV